MLSPTVLNNLLCTVAILHQHRVNSPPCCTDTPRVLSSQIKDGLKKQVLNMSPYKKHAMLREDENKAVVEKTFCGRKKSIALRTQRDN